MPILPDKYLILGTILPHMKYTIFLLLGRAVLVVLLHRFGRKTDYVKILLSAAIKIYREVSEYGDLFTFN